MHFAIIVSSLLFLFFKQKCQYLLKPYSHCFANLTEIFFFIKQVGGYNYYNFRGRVSLNRKTTVFCII